MVVTEGGRRVAILADVPSADYVGVEVVKGERPAVGRPGSAVRAVVEIHRALGGMIMRSLLGGEFTPDPQATTTAFVVPHGGELTFGASADCASELGRPLVAGLPQDFADAVPQGLSGDAGAALPAGQLRIDRAAVDEVGSSEMAFRLASNRLVRVIDSLIRSQDPSDAVRVAMASW